MLTRNLAWSLAAAAVLVAWGLGMAGGGGTSAAPDGLDEGATDIPNVPVLTQDGTTVRFYDDLIRNKKVLISFIYADCVKACPLSTAKMTQLQKRLGSRVGRDIFMYSITVNPEQDSPEVLKQYAGHYGIGPGWLLLTGTRKDIDALRFKFGERGDKPEDHYNLVRVGNGATGQWMNLSLFDDLDFLVREIGKMLIPDAYAGSPGGSYAEAPERVISERARLLLKGQTVFQNRCAACHGLGQGDHLGPDLQGVTERRARAWLAAFIASPDAMRARKDPIALALAARYSNVPMPNIGLSREQVADVIDYLGSLE